MEEKTDERTYEDAIQRLNNLQTNASVLANMKKEKEIGKKHLESLPAMRKFLERSKIDVNKLDRLNIIHVSGTKGKGSVCAFCESILRQYGLKTGFYSSPHLVEVGERIRINGKPLDRDLFTKYFFQLYDRLSETAVEHDGVMPGYFRFLTLMAFHVYLQENVDVAVLEVGLGGTYDCTNVINTPIVCGITKLEIDHAAVLGKEIHQIAAHKAGIMKPDRPAITIEQVKEAEDVLFEKSKEIKTPLYRIPRLKDFQENIEDFGIKGHHQEVNAVMAIQLARVWCYEKQDILQQRCPEKVEELRSIITKSPYENADDESRLDAFNLPPSFIQGLAEAKWLGRCQYHRKDDNFSYFLDGAHTKSSVEAFISWYLEVSGKYCEGFENISKILVFFITGERDSDIILKKLSVIDFEYVVFCPTIFDEKLTNANSDLTNYNRSRDGRLRKCFELEQKWLLMNVEGEEEQMETTTGLVNSTQKNSQGVSSSKTGVFPSITSAMKWIKYSKEQRDEKPPMNDEYNPDYPIELQHSDHVQVLVTGSLHLVGGILKFLGPGSYQ
eukprot:TCONS_00012724-protein